nr:MAG TPA: hypothetical protein [Caudoviricetes sp.]
MPYCLKVYLTILKNAALLLSISSITPCVVSSAFALSSSINYWNLDPLNLFMSSGRVIA